MSISAELALMLLAVALYLMDSLLLLHSNEAVLVKAGRKRWIAAFGATWWRIGGKEPLLLNPFTPYRPVFKLLWRFERAGISPADARLQTVPAEVAAFAPFVMAAMVYFFVLLPVGLLTPLGTSVAIAAVLALTLNNSVALAILYRRRERFGLSTPRFAVIAFECLVCPPFSLNLIRKLCAVQAITEDFTRAAARLVRGDSLRAVHTQCLARLDEQIDFEDESSPRMEDLQAARARFSQRPDA